MQEAASSLQTLRLIAAGILMGMLVLSVLPWVIELPEGSSNSVMQLAITAAAGTMIPAALFLRHSLMGTLALGSSDVMSMDQEAEPTPEDYKRYQNASIVGLAMSEAIVIFGFVLAFISGDPGQTLVFVVLGWGLALLQFPKASGLRAVARARVERSA